MAYCCPDCGWKWNRKDFYKVRWNGYIKKIFEPVTNVAKEGKYPILKDEYERNNITWWREIIYCPKCKREVEYDMNENIAKTLGED